MAINYEIKYPGVFIPALTDHQYVTLAQYVKGAYFVVAAEEELNAVADNALVQGQLAYVSSTGKSYRYNGSAWEEIDTPEVLVEKIEELSASVAELDEKLSKSISDEATTRRGADDALRVLASEAAASSGDWGTIGI